VVKRKAVCPINFTSHKLKSQFSTLSNGIDWMKTNVGNCLADSVEIRKKLSFELLGFVQV
jgi:hypothetical protein